MKTETLVLGNITFEETGVEEIAIVHSIEGIIHCEHGRAWLLADELVNEFGSYVIPQHFKGKIIWECRVPDFMDYESH